MEDKASLALALKKKTKWFLFKSFLLFSVVRGHNLFLLVIVQYFSAIFIISPENLMVHEIISDRNLFLLVVSTAICVASGYIINNFYDSEKDLINRPTQSYLNRLISSRLKINLYFLLNFLAISLSLLISYKAFLMFCGYIFIMWFHSHKLNKIVVFGNISAAFLGMIPYLLVLFYYENTQLHLFLYPLLMFCMVIMKTIVKDQADLSGDLVRNYRTIPVVYGNTITKKVLTGISLSIIIGSLFSVCYLSLNIYFNIYIFIVILALALFIYLNQKSKTKVHYLELHFLLKMLITFSVLCVIFIDLPRVLVYL